MTPEVPKLPQEEHDIAQWAKPAHLLSPDNPLMQHWVKVQEVAGPSPTRGKVFERLGETDELSGLRNRRGLLHELHQRFDNRAMTSDIDHEVALVFLDIDGFKYVNDKFGHEAGDDVLRNIGAFFSSEFQKNDTEDNETKSFKLGAEDEAFRIGGDEFVILLSIHRDEGGDRQVRPANEAIELFESRMNKGIKDSGKAVNGDIAISASLGAVVHKKGEKPESFIARADSLMYEVKMKKKALEECQKIEIHDFGTSLWKRDIEWEGVTYTVLDTNNLAQHIADVYTQDDDLTEKYQIDVLKAQDIYKDIEWLTLKYPELSKRIARLLMMKKEIIQDIKDKKQNPSAYIDWIADYSNEVNVLGTYAVHALYSHVGEDYTKLLI